MNSPDFSNIDPGDSVDVEFANGLVVKTTIPPYFETAVEAEHMASLVERYAAELASQPLSVAPLHNVAVVRRRGLFAVRHALEEVEGLPMSRLPFDERLTAAANMASQVCRMTTAPGTEKLDVPVDLHPGNIVSGTLVDIYPPLSRNSDGDIEFFAGVRGAANWEARFGRRDRALARLFGRAFVRSGMVDKPGIPGLVDYLMPDYTATTLADRIKQILAKDYA